jgi:hypothetical protein
VVEYAEPGSIIFRYDQLQTGAVLPTVVDPGQRELYLEDSIFCKIFSMTKAKFKELKKWKKDDLKKKYGLF